MRHKIRATIVLGFLLVVAQPTAVAARLQTREDNPELTAGRLIDRLRDAGQAIVDNAGRTMRDSAVVAVADLGTLADHLEDAFPANSKTPLSVLRQDREGEIEQALTALTLAEDAAKAMSACVREDVGAMLAAFRANFGRTVGAPGSWSRGRPRVHRLTDAAGAFPYVLRTGPAQLVTLVGADLRSDDCGPASATITSPDGERMNVDASIAEDRTVEFEVPPLDARGVYEVEVHLRRKKLIFFCRSTAARVSIAVMPSAPFRVRYTISTIQAVEQEIVWNAGELKVKNEECRSTTASRIFRLPEGWSYASHEWIVFLDSGAVKDREEVRDNALYVEYRVPGRGGPFCTGDPSLIHGRMEIHGRRLTLNPGPAVEGTVPRRVAFGEKVVVPVEIEPAEGASIAEWTIDVRVIYPDGSVRQIPVASGAGRLSERLAGGAGFSWNPETKSLTTTAPAATCPPASK